MERRPKNNEKSEFRKINWFERHFSATFQKNFPSFSEYVCYKRNESKKFKQVYFPRFTYFLFLLHFIFSINSICIYFKTTEKFLVFGTSCISLKSGLEGLLIISYWNKCHVSIFCIYRKRRGRTTSLR